MSVITSKAPKHPRLKSGGRYEFHVSEYVA